MVKSFILYSVWTQHTISRPGINRPYFVGKASKFESEKITKKQCEVKTIFF